MFRHVTLVYTFCCQCRTLSRGAHECGGAQDIHVHENDDQNAGPDDAICSVYVAPDKVCPEREFFIDNLLIRIHFIIVMIRWTGLAPWEFEFSFPGSLTSTIL